MKKYNLRYNTNSVSELDRWKVISEDGEILVSDIIIDTETKTTKDIIGGEEKFHITCFGNLSIKKGVAYITGKKSIVSRSRHILKTITWRIVGTIDTIVLSWIISGDPFIGLSIGGAEVITKMGLYYLHERAWYRSNFGVTKEEDKKN
jgi:uncharacterized membrane protein